MQHFIVCMGHKFSFIGLQLIDTEYCFKFFSLIKNKRTNKKLLGCTIEHAVLFYYYCICTCVFIILGKYLVM